MPANVDIAEMTDAQFRQHTLTLISRELGLYGYARFLRLFCAGTGDYTRDRHQWLDGITIEDIQRDLTPQTVPDL